MSIRLFEWRDLPLLHRYRNECLFLDSTPILTSGPIFAPAGALLSTLSPVTGIFTYLYQEDDLPVLFGQVTHVASTASAHLSFLTPRAALEDADIPALLDQMATQVVERGGLRLLAEVEEQLREFDLFRQVGFGVYARQRIWQLPEGSTGVSLTGLRRATNKRDQASVRFLYANLVPGLVQQAEQPSGGLRGLVYYRGQELLAYFEVRYGTRGIWVQPFVHPDAEVVAEQMFRVLQDLPFRSSRPVYICVRSYQSWLETVLETLGAQPGPRQGVLVRHLAGRVAHTYAVPALNGKTTEPTVPVAHTRRMYDRKANNR